MTRKRKFERHIRHYLEGKNQRADLKWFREFECDLRALNLIVQTTHVRGEGTTTSLETHFDAGNREVNDVLRDYLQSLAAHPEEAPHE